MSITRVLIVEDHPLFSKGLTSLIVTEPLFMIAGEAKNTEEALKLLHSTEIDLAIVDLNLGDEDGINVIKELKSLTPNIRVLVLSMHDERYYAERVLRAGAHGYIMKTQAGKQIIDAIKTVMAGKIYMSEAERDRLLSIRLDTGWETSIKVLSNRQLQIFSLIGKGFGTTEIAAQLKVSAKTVDAHKEHIKQKLHCASSQELRQFAIKWVNAGG
jgi:DNA-binding NarL/FixJ family response regulator